MSATAMRAITPRRKGEKYLQWNARIQSTLLKTKHRNEAQSPSPFSRVYDDDEKKQPLKQIKRILVIAVGIVDYDVDDYAKLPDAREDVTRYERVFKDLYRYQFRAKVGKGITSKELKRFLFECKEYLIVGKYHGAIISFSCHGNQTGVICSDGVVLTYLQLYSIFAGKRLREKIRVFVFDTCQVVDHGKKLAPDVDLAADSQNQDADTMFLILKPNSNGRVVKEGMLARHLALAFEDRLLEADGALSPLCTLQEILDVVHSGIQKASQGKQGLIMTGSPDVKKVVFRCGDGARVGTEWHVQARIVALQLVVTITETRNETSWEHTFDATHAVFEEHTFIQVKAAFEGSKFVVPRRRYNLEVNIFGHDLELEEL